MAWTLQNGQYVWTDDVQQIDQQDLYQTGHQDNLGGNRTPQTTPGTSSPSAGQVTPLSSPPPGGVSTTNLPKQMGDTPWLQGQGNTGQQAQVSGGYQPPQQQGYQQQSFNAPQPFQGGQTFTPGMPAPPPPPPPPPNFTQAANAGQLPDLPQFQAPDAPPDAPDYMSLVSGIPGYEAPEGPGGAQDFSAIAQNLPHYQTPEGAFMGEDMYNALQQYAQDWMDNPNPYLSDLANAQREASMGRISAMEQEGTRATEEWAGARGLVGSSFEGEQMNDLRAQMRQQAAEDEARSLQQLAEGDLAGRQAAGAQGLGTGQLGAQLGQQRIDEAINAQQLALQRGDRELAAATAAENAEQFRASYGLQDALQKHQQALAQGDQQLAAASLEEAANQFRSQFDLDVQKFGHQAAFQNVQLQSQHALQQAGLNLQAAMAGDAAAMDRARHELNVIQTMERATMDRAQLEQQDRQIDQRAWEIMGNWEMQGQQMDFEQAKFQAELEYRQERDARSDFESDRGWEEQMRQYEDWLRLQGGQN